MLPHNLTIEKAILGAMMLNPAIKPDVAKIIMSSDFYSEKNQILFDTIKDNESDAVIIASELTKKNALNKIGGIEYLTELLNYIGTSSPAIQYSHQLKDISVRRGLILSANELIEKCNKPSEQINDILHEHKQAILSAESEQQEDIRSTNTLLNRVMDDIQVRMQSGSSLVGLSSGFEKIDYYTQGFEPATQILIAARPSIGKTALALNIAENMARGGDAVLFFSLEMSAEAITRRRLSAESGVYLSRIRAGHFEGNQLDRVIYATNKLNERKLITVDNPRYKTIENLIPMAESYALKETIKAIYVDHIQLIRSSKTYSSRHQEISYISDALKSLAKTLNIPVVVLCQLNRGADTHEGQRPELRSLKESGDLEQNADIVIGLYRETKESELLELGGLKGRDTGTWKSALLFNRYTQQITDMEGL